MALADFLFEGKAPPSVTSNVTNITGLPDWYQEFQKGILARGNAIASEPYQSYDGPRIADLTPDQLNAFEMVRQSLGTGQSALTAGENAGNLAAQPFNQDIFDQFKSNNVDAVVDRIGDLGARNLQEKLLPSVNNTFTGGGMFGGDRHADFTARTVRDANESILGQQAVAMQQAYDNSMGAYNNAMSRVGGMASTLGSLGTMQQTASLRDAAALEGIGSTQQSLDQADLDNTYQEFINQRDYPKTNLGMLNDLLRGIGNVPTTSTSTTTGQTGQYGASPLAQLAGAGAGLAGIMNLFK